MNTKVLLLGLLVLVGAGAFVYLDPMDLDLLGLKQEQVVAKTVAAPKHPAAAVPHPAATAAQTPNKAAVPAAVPAAEPAAKAKPAPTPLQPVAAPGVAAVSAPASAEPEAAPAVQPRMASAEIPVEPVAPVAPPAKKPARTESKPPRPMNLDLRHCLDLKTDAEIAKCAGE